MSRMDGTNYVAGLWAWKLREDHQLKRHEQSLTSHSHSNLSNFVLELELLRDASPRAFLPPMGWNG